MSELRSKYPQAKAWTFVLPDTPPGTGTAASRSVAAGGGGCGHRTGPEATKQQQQKKQQQQHKKKRSLGNNSKGVEMGSLCSSNKNVADKENMGKSACDEDLVGVSGEMGGQADEVGGAPTVAEKTPKGVERLSGREAGGDRRAGGSDKGEGKVVVNNGHVGYAEGMLDSTAFLSPDTVPAASVEGRLYSEGEDRAFFEAEQGGGTGEEEGGRSAWLARNLALLKGGRAVDVGQLKQVRFCCCTYILRSTVCCCITSINNINMLYIVFYY